MNQLWYRKPAKQWEEALPLGNGRLGAMVFGGIDKERIQVNEESMWYGGKGNRNNPDLKAYLPQVRKLLSDGKIREAERLLLLAGSGCPQSEHPYQTLGEIELDYHCRSKAERYHRSLDLEAAVANVHFSLDSVDFEREFFISRPGGCMLMRLKASEQGKINLTAALSRGRFYDGVGKWHDDGILLRGNLGRGGVEFAAMLRAKIKGGCLRLIGESLCIEAADEVILYYAADTTYHIASEVKERYVRRYFAENVFPEDLDYFGLNELERKEYLYQMALQSLLQEQLAERIDSCMNTGYESLRAEHIRDYRSLFGRVKLTLDVSDGNEADARPTDERLSSPCGDIGLMKQLFDYGRYLLICSSREGDLPATLQGIWNKEFTPPWDSKYTININLEMNYWPAEICNLAECHTTLLPLLKKMQINGRKTARQMYGCRGFVAHHNTDIHGDCSPQDHWIPGTYWVMGAAWLCTHLWIHYEYTRDKVFLREAFPVMAEAALFFVDFLIEKDGYLVTSPSVSPENTYILPTGEQGACCIGATMDNQILRHFLKGCIEAGKVLGDEVYGFKVDGIDDMEAFLTQIAMIKDRLMPTRVGSRGTIMEWMEEYEEAEPGHRHISHLYGLYPSDEITMDGTPELAAAARKTLERRLQNGGGHTGWSRAWIMNHYAKLWDGEKAYENLEKMLEKSTYPNLFDKHPPFQIDGNFGAAAAIAQMLVQSNRDRVVLLPALPKAWKSGMVKGLRLAGNAEIVISWKDGKLQTCSIYAFSDYDARIKYKEKTVHITLRAGENCQVPLP